MFRGVVNLNLDDKGRLAVPKRYRALLTDRYEGKVVITMTPPVVGGSGQGHEDKVVPPPDEGKAVPPPDVCSLSIYPLKIWEPIERKLDQLPTFNPVARMLQGTLTGHATEVEMDMSGRLMVPLKLRKYAGIGKEAVLMGQSRRFDLWDAKRFEAKRGDWLKDIKDLGEQDLPPEVASLSL